MKNYGNDEAANLWAITNPHKPKGADYYVYTVVVSHSSSFVRVLMQKVPSRSSGDTKSFTC